jgi:predicted glycosyltransferase
MPGSSSAIARVGDDMAARSGSPDRRVPPRVMFYSDDTSGLGHLRRTVTLARHFRKPVARDGAAHRRGLPLAKGYRLPGGADYVELPPAVKVGARR